MATRGEEVQSGEKGTMEYRFKESKLAIFAINSASECLLHFNGHFPGESGSASVY